MSGRVCAYTGYREDTAHPVHRLETPTGALSLIVSFGDGLRAQAVPDAAELSDYTSFVVGMHDRPARTAHDGHQLGIQVRLDPLGAFSLLGVPLRSSGSPSRLPIGYRTSGQLASTRTCPSFTSSSGAMCDKRSTLVRTCSARRSRRSALPIQPMWPSGPQQQSQWMRGALPRCDHLDLQRERRRFLEHATLCCRVIVAGFASRRARAGGCGVAGARGRAPYGRQRARLAASDRRGAPGLRPATTRCGHPRWSCLGSAPTAARRSRRRRVGVNEGGEVRGHVFHLGHASANGSPGR